MGKRGPIPDPVKIKERLRKENRLFTGPRAHAYPARIRHYNQRPRGIVAVLHGGQWHVTVEVGKFKIKAVDDTYIGALQLIDAKWRRRLRLQENRNQKLGENIEDVLWRALESNERQPFIDPGTRTLPSAPPYPTERNP